jgi:hypothetical protein
MDCKNVIASLNVSRPGAAILFCLFLTVSSSAFAQRQLIVLKQEQVLARYQEGDILHFFRAKDKEIQIQKILDMNDTLLMMNQDSVAYFRIVKLDIRGRKKGTFAQKLGAYMMFAGVLLPAIELLNTGVFQDEDRNATVSPGVLTTSAVLIGGGAALVFIKKPYLKPRRKYRLMIIDKRSPFYKVRPTRDGYNSPYIPNN